jgi:hypothetical protein
MASFNVFRKFVVSGHTAGIKDEILYSDKILRAITTALRRHSQFAYNAGPMIGDESIHRFGRESADLFFVSL